MTENNHASQFRQHNRSQLQNGVIISCIQHNITGCNQSLPLILLTARRQSKTASRFLLFDWHTSNIRHVWSAVLLYMAGAEDMRG